MVSYPHDLVRFHKKSTIDIFNSAAPSVVYIFTENAESGIFGRREIQRGAGSGFLWDRHGHVVTNFHVIQGSQSIQVRLDSAGRLIGVNTAIISGSGSSAGIGFAVTVCLSLTGCPVGMPRHMKAFHLSLPPIGERFTTFQPRKSICRHYVKSFS